MSIGVTGGPQRLVVGGRCEPWLLLACWRGWVLDGLCALSCRLSVGRGGVTLPVGMACVYIPTRVACS